MGLEVDVMVAGGGLGVDVVEDVGFGVMEDVAVLEGWFEKRRSPAF